jgi:MFS family permease
LHEPGRQHYNVTFALLGIAGVSYSLLQSLVAPALPDIQHALHTSENSVSWVLTAYLLSASVATPLIGRLGDMYGKERLLMIVLALLSLGTVVSALSSGLPLMIVGRVIQGAAGGIFPLAFGIIRDEFPRERVAAGIGLMSALLGVGGGAGVVLAGPIVDNLSFHYLFWLPLIPIVLATIAIHVFVPESPVRVPGRVNWTGAALMSAGLALVLVAVSETATWHWLSAKTLGVIAAGLVLLVLWVRSESASPQPLVDMRMMRIRGVWTTNAVALLLGFGMYSSFILLPQFVETPRRAGYGFGASVTQAGLFMVPSTLAMLVVGSQTGRFEKWFGSKPPLLAGGVLSFVSFVLLARARRALGDLSRGGAPRQRHRPRLRRHGEPDHRERRPGADGCRDRHEHRHPHRRRRLRRRRDRVVARGHDRRERVSDRARLHPGVRPVRGRARARRGRGPRDPAAPSGRGVRDASRGRHGLALMGPRSMSSRGARRLPVNEQGGFAHGQVHHMPVVRRPG